MFDTAGEYHRETGVDARVSVDGDLTDCDAYILLLCRYEQASRDDD